MERRIKVSREATSVESRERGSVANGESGSRCYGYDRFVSESHSVSLQQLELEKTKCCR